jgi:hypothetical protein
MESIMNNSMKKLWPWTMVILATAICAGALAASEPAELLVTVDKMPRPVAAAVEGLQSRHGIVITYEDPAYQFAGDLADVPKQDQDARPHGQTARGLVPRAGSLEVRYTARADGEIEITAVLADILAAHEAADGAGRFQILVHEGHYHVVPSATRTANGQWVAAISPFDRLIDIADEERTVLETIELVLEQVATVSGQQVELMMFSRKTMNTQRIRLTAVQEPAREILERALSPIPYPLSWNLYFDPASEDHESYVMNLSVIGNRSTAAEPREPITTVTLKPVLGGG